MFLLRVPPMTTSLPSGLLLLVPPSLLALLPHLFYPSVQAAPIKPSSLCTPPPTAMAPFLPWSPSDARNLTSTLSAYLLLSLPLTCSCLLKNATSPLYKRCSYSIFHFSPANSSDAHIIGRYYTATYSQHLSPAFLCPLASRLSFPTYDLWLYPVFYLLP